MLGQVLPKHGKVPFDTINKLMTKREISSVIDQVYRHCGQKETVIFCDRIMALGFYNAFKAGISFGKDDMVVPHGKWKIVDDTRTMAKDFEQQYNDGLITQGEKYNKVGRRLGESLGEDRRADDEGNFVRQEERQGRGFPDQLDLHDGSLRCARFAGADASARRHARPDGQADGSIIETPIVSNFKEGLTVMEYFNSTHGARKGLADTALKTANSGYLTRRLVDVAQDCIITQDDCGTKLGIKMRAIIDAGTVVASLASRILGRTAGEDLRDPATNKVVVKRGTLMEEDTRRRHPSGRHPGSEDPLGADLRTGQRHLRQVLRARSCPRYSGQPRRGCRRYCRAVPSASPARSLPCARSTSVARRRSTSSRSSSRTSTARSSSRTRRSQPTAKVSTLRWFATWSLRLSIRTVPSVRRIAFNTARACGVDEGDMIKRGQRIAEWDPYSRPVLTEVEGTIGFEDLVEGQSISETLDESTGIAKRVVIDWRTTGRGADLRPAIVVKGKDGKVLKLARGGDARYMLSVDAILSVDVGAKVKAGDILARVSTESAKTRDITAVCARRGTVRSTQAEGCCDHRGNQRHDPLRPRLQEQAPYLDRADRQERGDSRVPHSEGQAHPSAGRRHRRKGRFHRPKAIRRRTTSWRSRASRNSLPIWSTKSRKFIGCRACSSTTSTSR